MTWLRRWWPEMAAVALVAGLFFGVYAWGYNNGRASVKPTVVTETRTVATRDTHATGTQESSRLDLGWLGETSGEVDTWFRPDGTVARKRMKAAAKQQQVRVEYRDMVVVEWKDREVVKVEEKRVEVPAPLPRWSVTGGYGVTTGLDRAWMVGASYRVAGPFELGLTASRAGGVTAGYVTGTVRF